MPASPFPTNPPHLAVSTPAPAGRTGKPAPLVLGARVYQPAAWWTDPVRAILFLIMPIFCFAAYFNQFNYWTFNASEDFVTFQTFGLGLYSAGLMIGGIALGRLAIRRQDMVTLIDADRAALVLTRLGWITILAYALLLGTLVTQFGLVLDLLRGDSGAASGLREVLGRVPGVTSFIQCGVVYLALASALIFLTEFRMTSRLWAMTATIFALTLIRAVVASERLALLEALAAIMVIPVAYLWRPSVWRSLAPFIGAVFVFVAFSAGEYIRSWQFYQYYYDSYAEFIVPRFAGYFSTSINNGAGAYIIYAQYNPMPEITSSWLTKFPLLGKLISNPEMTLMDRFLANYATPEFNNPSGFYAAFLDYRLPIASMFMLLVGGVIGVIHRSFHNKQLFGLIMYPAVFLGLTDLIRILYISDTRTLPIFLGAGVALWALRPRQLPRDQFLAQVARAQAQTKQ